MNSHNTLLTIFSLKYHHKKDDFLHLLNLKTYFIIPSPTKALESGNEGAVNNHNYPV